MKREKGYQKKKKWAHIAEKSLGEDTPSGI
jgi:hypothetical protein